MQSPDSKPSTYEQFIARGLERAREKFAQRETVQLEALRMVVFSDQHRGAKTGADDFAPCEDTYRAALEYYLKDDYRLMLLGDVEELWECSPRSVIDAYKDTLKLEQRFHSAGGYTRFYGNHDDIWTTPWQFKMHLSPYICDAAGEASILEALSVQVNDGDRILGELFFTHGHQGTPDSDRFAPLSRFLVRYVWRPLQRLLQIRSNTPSQDYDLRLQHEFAMSRWAVAQRRLLLITGHTHHPVFPLLGGTNRAKLDLEDLRARAEKRDLFPEERQRLQDEIGFREAAIRLQQPSTSNRASGVSKSPRPCFFNTGCCSFSDGDITGIEIADGEIRLVRWSAMIHGVARRIVRSAPLKDLFDATTPAS